MTLASPDPPLSDGVVSLRAPDERDLGAIDQGIHDPAVIRWFGQPDASAAEVLALNRQRWRDGSPTFAVCEIDDVCVGHVWINRTTQDPAVGSIGYWLLPAARGQGLATRAVRLLTQWSVERMGLTQLRLLTEPANHRSQRVAEASGFVSVGMLVGAGEVDCRSVDLILFTWPSI